MLRFDASRRSDFFRLHSEANAAGWCHCIAWWVPTWEGWGERSASENRRLRDELCDRGEYDGYLLYVDGDPVGWCQIGPRDRLVKIVRQYQLFPDPKTWAITCFFIAPSHRQKGLASYLLHEVVRDLAKRGVRRIEAYPKCGEGLEAHDLWTGAEAMFREAGFRVIRDDPKRPVLALER
ncbi:MAG: hypothetical protein A2Z21_09280 [Candidatus Fraserbacteria bacterium RBG_16_55_9]|uniref:N-acetyltransferase domain-containing protein n=1 Tax=Fraserbacteria sp. (strain RBG_16_55_9) TaxID=1817864 RepID=A0A1F5UVT4_FRAXR|nr:MAG: hypothetical protein A2Z21_09280 [Candidatus Fraserbacteria bacterium RBG_16_55_9]